LNNIVSIYPVKVTYGQQPITINQVFKPEYADKFVPILEET